MAAAQGYASAQFNLGIKYKYGHGVPRDPAEAVNWFRKAARLGNAYAQYNLGFMYFMGQGVAQDYTEAMAWYQPAFPK